jgi:hypothetical protein
VKAVDHQTSPPSKSIQEHPTVLVVVPPEMVVEYGQRNQNYFRIQMISWILEVSSDPEVDSLVAKNMSRNRYGIELGNINQRYFPISRRKIHPIDIICGTPEIAPRVLEVGSKY